MTGAPLGDRSRDGRQLEAFLLALSSSLGTGRGFPATYPEVSDSDLRQILTRFLANAKRLPETVHGRLAVALNHDQVPSKLWLVEHLAGCMPLQRSRVLVVGGWFGVLPFVLQCLYPTWRVRTHVIDLDPEACEVARVLLEGVVEDVTVSCSNANRIDYGEVRRDPRSLVVNTICEHMSDFREWFERVPQGQAIALQSNDHWGCSEHTNCVESLEELEEQAPLVETRFRGSLALPTFQRFMLLGYR